MNQNYIYIALGLGVIAFAWYLKKQKDEASSLQSAPPAPSPSPSPTPTPSPSPAPAPTPSLPTLQRGVSSPYAAKLQRGINALLNALPSPTAKPAILSVDGNFGALTETALLYLTNRSSISPAASSAAASYPFDVLAVSVKSNLFSITAAAQILAFVL